MLNQSINIKRLTCRSFGAEVANSLFLQLPYGVCKAVKNLSNREAVKQ